MRLSSVSGATVELSVVGYEFGPSPQRDDPDANWLVVSGRVRLPDGRSWSFTDPALMTWEALSLGSWLEGVASGAVLPVADFGGEDDERLLTFTEPNLAFSVGRRDGDAVTVRVHFSLECAPVWVRGGGAGVFEYFVEFDVPREAVAVAAGEWAQDVAPFPVR